MPIDISTLSNATTAATALSNLILVTPNENKGYQPQNPALSSDSNGQTRRPPPAILFNYEGEQTVALESDITDHYVEDNTAVQDQIALRPIVVTTHGFIGELNDVVPGILNPLKFAADKLTAIAGYEPQLSVTALVAYNQAKLIYDTAANVLDVAVSAWNTVFGTNAQTKQQKYFQDFYGYFNQRTLFTVQTPWAIFNDMAIKSLRAIQDAETNMITDFEITFKQIRYAQSVTTRVLSADFMQGRAAAQGSLDTQMGVSTPPLSPKSFLGEIGNIA